MHVFPENGPKNTEETLRIALKAAAERGLTMLVSSNTGETVEKLLAIMEETGLSVPVVMGGQVDGFSAPGTNALTAGKRAFLEGKGVKIVTAAHALSGAERGLSGKFSGVYPVEIVAHTLRMLGQGTKVCVEIGMMAMDCGALEYGKPVVAVAGTNRGADTAVILTPSYTADFLSTKIHEILCKPGLYN